MKISRQRASRGRSSVMVTTPLSLVHAGRRSSPGWVERSISFSSGSSSVILRHPNPLPSHSVGLCLHTLWASAFTLCGPLPSHSVGRSQPDSYLSFCDLGMQQCWHRPLASGIRNKFLLKVGGCSAWSCWMMRDMLSELGDIVASVCFEILICICLKSMICGSVADGGSCSIAPSAFRLLKRCHVSLLDPSCCYFDSRHLLGPGDSKTAGVTFGIYLNLCRWSVIT